MVFPGAGNLGFTLLEYRLGQRNIVDAFIEPILQDAIRKKEERQKAGLGLDNKENEDDETLLDHLVKQTTGT